MDNGSGRCACFARTLERRAALKVCLGIALLNSSVESTPRITADGFRKLPAAEAEQIAEQVVRERMTRPDGPVATLRNG